MFGKEESTRTGVVGIIYFGLYISLLYFTVNPVANNDWTTTRLGLFSYNGTAIDSKCMVGETDLQRLKLCSKFNAVRAFAVISVLFNVAGLLVAAWHLFFEETRDPDKDMAPMFIFSGICTAVTYYVFQEWLGLLGNGQLVGENANQEYVAFLLCCSGLALSFVSFLWKTADPCAEEEYEI